jgi:hypothetical protein
VVVLDLEAVRLEYESPVVEQALVLLAAVSAPAAEQFLIRPLQVSQPCGEGNSDSSVSSTSTNWLLR